MAFAGHEFARTRPTADGATEGDHVASALRQQAMLGKRKKIATPDAPELPDDIAYLWTWFIALVSGCALDGFGVAVVTWSDIHAWSAMTRNVPAPWETDVLMKLAGKFAASRAPKK
jgi:hypothetical protein